MKSISIPNFFYPLILCLFIASCNSEPSPCFEDYTVHEPIELACDTLFSTTFLAGQTIPVGNVSVGVQDDNLLVTFTTTGDWVMDESHVYVGDCGEIPLSGGCNPQFGQFPYTVHPVIFLYPLILKFKSIFHLVHRRASQQWAALPIGV